jgi:hypothetical protein
MNKPENIFCRVCGYEYSIDNPAWNDDETPSHDICICCGVQFGYEDDAYEGVINYRTKWLNEGAKWFSFEQKPSEWNFEIQKNNIADKWK